MNRNHFALLMEMSLGPALALAISAGSRMVFWSYAATVVLICVALVLANSRGGIVSIRSVRIFLLVGWSLTSS